MIYTNFRWGFTGEKQSMRVDGGRVVSRGAAVFGEGVDLGGAWMLPAFVDNHCHILPAGLDLQKLHLGPCGSHEAVLDAVRDRLALTPDGNWLLAVHYDQTRYSEGRHLTRGELDAISPSVPILLRHVNGHASVANSAALRLARVAEDQADPAGGEFGRDSSGALNGVLFEAAHEHVTKAVPNPSLEEMVEAILDIGRLMASQGIGTASDMMTGRYDLLRELEAYRLASERGCPVRLRMYLQWGEVFGPRAVAMSDIEARLSAMNEDRCRVAGIKIFADGAIGSATAAIYGRYSGQTAAGPVLTRRATDAAKGAPEGVEVSGQLIYSPDRLRQMVLTAHEAGHQVAIHSIGDYSTDLVLDAFEATGEPSRHRIEHAMILSDAQIERMARLNPFCSMQPEFLMRFGHSYLRQLGPERASKLKRLRSVKDAGIRLSLSSDRPIVAGDPWDGVLTASSRPEGFDPAEALTRQEALLGYTREGARCLGDSDLGGLEPGDFADFALWNEDPLSCSVKPQIQRLEIAETSWLEIRATETRATRAGSPLTLPHFYYHPRMLEYEITPSHPLKPERLRRAIELMERLGVVPIDPGLASEADVLRVHDRRYLEAVRRLDPAESPDDELGEDDALETMAEFGFMSSDNPVFPRMYVSSLAYLGATVRAAEAVRDGAALAFGIAGGLHHALRAKASGFCVFNDPAVACHILREKFERVAYVDIDVHHGDGVQWIFYNDPSVLTCSIHEEGRSLWPGTGWTSETGVLFSSLNVPIQARTTGDVWLDAFERGILPALERFQPEAIVLQMGTDTHYLDPLAHLQNTAQEWLAAVVRVRDFGVPIVALGGGGYNLSTVPRMWTAACLTLGGRQVPELVPEDLAEAWGMPRFFDEVMPGPRGSGGAYADEVIDWLQTNHHPNIRLA